MWTFDYASFVIGVTSVLVLDVLVLFPWIRSLERKKNNDKSR